MNALRPIPAKVSLSSPSFATAAAASAVGLMLLLTPSGALAEQLPVDNGSFSINGGVAVEASDLTQLDACTIDSSHLEALSDKGFALGQTFMLISTEAVDGCDFDTKYVLVFKPGSRLDISSLPSEELSLVIDLSDQEYPSLFPSDNATPTDVDAGLQILADAQASGDSDFRATLFADWQDLQEQPTYYLCDGFVEGLKLLNVHPAEEEDLITFAQSSDAGQEGKAKSRTSAEISVACTVSLAGSELHEGEFEFELSSVDGSPLPKTVVAVNDDLGAIEFDPVVFDSEGIYRYQVSQRHVGSAGIVLDDGTVDVVVTVTRDDDGFLSAVQSETVAFSNSADTLNSGEETSYLPVTVDLSTSVEVSGASMNEGALQFKITLKHDAPEPQTTMAVNSADGLVNFGDTTFSAPGEYVYEIVQVPGDIAGMTYDNSVLTCIVTVSQEEEDGTLAATVSFSPKQGFTNSYSKPGEGTDASNREGESQSGPHSASAIISASVNQLSGKAAAGSVELMVVSDDGSVVSSGTNDANGIVRFGSIDYSEPGLYSYTIRPSTSVSLVKGTNFDSSDSYRVQVEVEDTGSGLLARISYPDGRPAFMVSTASATEVAVAAESSDIEDAAEASGEQNDAGLPSFAVIAIVVCALALATAITAIVVIQKRTPRKSKR